MTSYKLELIRNTVTPELRAFILNSFACPDQSPEWKCLCYLLCATPSPDPDGLPIAKDYVADWFGVRRDAFHRHHRFDALHHLRLLASRIPELSIEIKDRQNEGKHHTVKFSVPENVQVRINEEFDSDWTGPKGYIYLLDGGKLYPRRQKQERDKQLASVDSINAERLQGATQDGLLILDYLNNLPVNGFTKVLNNREYAQQAINTLKLAENNKKRTEVEAKRRERSILSHIGEQPQQFYYLAEDTTRIIPSSNHICALKAEIRQALTKDWVELDLKNVQLAINATLWNLPQVQNFLKTDKSWWQELFDYFYLPYSETLKGRFKTATYALCYGATKKTIREGEKNESGEIIKEGLGKHAKQFFKHPLVKELWKARQRMLNQISEQNGMKDAYGRWIAINPSKEITKRSVLAQIAQSYEQAIIVELFKLASSD